MNRATITSGVLACLLLAAAVPVFGQPAGLGGTPGEPAPGGGFRVGASLVYPRQAPGFPTLARVTLTCAPDHYVWADSIEIEIADAGGAGDGVGVGELFLPARKTKYDETLEDTVEYFDGEFAFSALLEIAQTVEPGEYDLVLRVRYTGCGPGLCQLRTDEAAVGLTITQDEPPVVIEVPDVAPSEPTDSGSSESLFAGRGAVLAVLIAFAAGLGLTLTPCVYPLIPVTIGLVGATAGGKRLDGLVRSLVYVLGISVSYSVIGTVAAATGSVFGSTMQHPAVYLALAVVFVLLAGGMFGLYAIDVSSQRLQRLQARLRGRAGLVGIFVIGLLSGVAATACIAPIILGILTYVAQSRDLVLGFAVFFALAWGMGTPLVVLGASTGLAKSIPKAGAWMVTVKKAFGLALLAAAVYFIGKSGVLAEFWFRMLLVAFLVGAGVFIGAFDVLSAEAGWWARLRKTIGLLFLVGAVAVFLQPAMESRLPPEEPAAIEWLDSEPDALALARSQGKPVLLDFWGERCAPCIRMLRTTFVDPQVVAQSRRFVCAKINVGQLEQEEWRRLHDEYGVWGVPTVVLIGSGGERQARVRYVGPDELLQMMSSVR